MGNYDKLRELVKRALEGELVATYDHSNRVYDWCLKMGKELGANLDVLLPAALVHDVGVPINKEKHYEVGKEKAKMMLQEANFPEKDMEHILHCMEAHSCYGGPDPGTLEAKILYDADKIDCVGAIGLIRGILRDLGNKSFKGNINEGPLVVERLKGIAGHVEGFAYTDFGKKVIGQRIAFLEDFAKRLKAELQGVE